jgi:hypothetical protein
VSELPDDKPRRLTWRCAVCKRLLVLRPTTETEEAFLARSAEHERRSITCRAKVLIKQLYADGFVPLRSESGRDFAPSYHPLKDAGLTVSHRTHIVGDWVRPTPWGPRWAVLYDAYLIRSNHSITLPQRIEALRESVVTPGGPAIEAFLALADVRLAIAGAP